MSVDIAAAQGRLLIYAPVPIYRQDGQIFAENQASNGLRLWAENFDHLTVMMPVRDGPPPVGWSPVADLGPALDRIEIVPMPTTWDLRSFLRQYRATARRIRDCIDQADYLSFAIGGLVGDWGAVACRQAHAMNRPYAVWTDRVESAVTRTAAQSGSLKRRVKNHLTHRPMLALEKWVIRRATLGLFHGQQTYDAYAGYCRNPQIVHDIHVKRADHIDDASFARKRDSAATDPLRIVYAGRASAMKGPLDWAGALDQLNRAGVAFHADWLGDGPLLEDLRQQLDSTGLSQHVTLHGFVDDPARVKSTLQDAHIFLFCHNTPESPRCLIESLVAATPIIGFDGSYAADLIKGAGGGVLVPVGDVDALAQVLIDLAANRDRLAGLIDSARADGAPFDDVSVFEHRSDLIKRYLTRHS